MTRDSFSGVAPHHEPSVFTRARHRMIQSVAAAITWPALVFLCCGLLAHPQSGRAAELSEKLRINGFGSFGVVTNDSHEVGYRLHEGQLGSAKQGEFNFGLNSVVGLQLSYQATDWLSLTAQGLVRYLDEDDWEDDLDWAYLDIDAPWDFSLRLGKIRFPLFRSSELAYVGYARTFVRPAIRFYGVGGYDDLKGIQVSRAFDFGNLELGLQANYGYSDATLPQHQIPSGGAYYEDVAKSDDIKILSAYIESSSFWLHLAYTDLTSDITRNWSTGGRESRGSAAIGMWSAEWQLNWAGFVLDGGYGRALIEELLPDETVFYSALSRPMGKFTPYILYSYKSLTDLPPPSQPPGSQGGPPRENRTRPAGPPPDDSDEILSLGLRYDPRPGIALKLEYDYVHAAGGSGGFSDNLTHQRAKYSAVSLVLDWMF